MPLNDKAQKMVDKLETEKEQIKHSTEEMSAELKRLLESEINAFQKHEKHRSTEMISKGDYEADSGDADRCITSMNQYLIYSGYPELYVGNPYDWIFFYAAKREEPLYVFRYVWNELLTGVLEKHQ